MMLIDTTVPAGRRFAASSLRGHILTDAGEPPGLVSR